LPDSNSTWDAGLKVMSCWATLRYMLQNLVERCGGFPNLLAAAQLVQSTVMALLPGS